MNLAESVYREIKSRSFDAIRDVLRNDRLANREIRVTVELEINRNVYTGTWLQRKELVQWQKE